MKDNGCDKNRGENDFAEDENFIRKERVDVFGDMRVKKRTRTKKTILPVKYEHLSDSRAGTGSLLYLIFTVLFLTASFTALFCGVASSLGNSPREAMGGFAGNMIFGKQSQAGEDTSGTDAGQVGADVTDRAEETGNVEPDGSGTEAASDTGRDETSPSVTENTRPVEPTGGGSAQLINDTEHDIDLDMLADELGAAVKAELRGKKVLVLAAHPCEGFADTGTVADAVQAFCQAIGAVGIDVLTCDGIPEISGRLGAYSRARAEIEKMLASEPDIGLIVDLHTGTAPGITVGGGADDMWRMNTALAALINRGLDTYSGSVTVTRGIYNQDLPVMSLHVTFDSAEKSSRGTKSARILADAVIKLMKKSA